MMKQSELRIAVRDMLDAKTESDKSVATSWLVREFVMQHPTLDGPDRDFHDLCVYSHVRSTVRDVLGDVRDQELKEQLHFEGSGFKHLQQRYPIDVGEGETLVVPLLQMTAEQCDAKADEYDRMIKGFAAHSEELRQWARMLRSRAHAA